MLNGPPPVVEPPLPSMAPPPYVDPSWGEPDAAAAASSATGNSSAQHLPASEGMPKPIDKRVFLKRRKPKDAKFYDLLGVAHTATPEEIKRAYYRQALRLHPDKGGDPAEFTEMKRAYDTLYKLSRRDVYDKYGPEIIDILDSGGGKPAELMFKMQVWMESPLNRLCVLLVVSVFFGFILLTPILIAARWDGDDWSWAITLIPVWLVQASMMLNIFVTYRIASNVLKTGGFQDKEANSGSVGGPADRDEEDPTPATSAPPPVDAEGVRDAPLDEDDFELRRVVKSAPFYLFVCVCAFVCQALIVCRLDDTVTFTWFGVFAPWLAAELALMVWCYLDAEMEMVHILKEMKSDIAEMKEALQEIESDPTLDATPRTLMLLQLQAQIEEREREAQGVSVSGAYLVSAWMWPVLRMLTVLLIASKADGRFSTSWFVICVPIVFGALFSAVENVRAGTEGECVGYCQFMCQVLIAVLAASAVNLLMLLLGLGKLDDASVYSAFAVFAPIFIVVGLVYCATGSVILACPNLIFREVSKKRDANKTPNTAAQAPPASDSNAGQGQQSSQPPPSEQQPTIILGGYEPPPAQEPGATIILGGYEPPPAAQEPSTQEQQQGQEEGAAKPAEEPSAVALT